MEEIRKKSWFARNWPWVVPVGGCLTVIILFVLGIGAIFFGVSKAITGSAPYEYAMESASNNTEVLAVLGASIESDGIMQGSISLNGSDSGDVDIIIPIKGTKGKGSIIVVGNKIDGEWIYEELYVLIKETGEQINLLQKALEDI